MLQKNKLLPSRPSLLDTIAHSAIQRAILSVLNVSTQDNDNFYCIDATAGNGHDTCALAKFCNDFEKMHIVACDIQEQALMQTRMRLKDNDLNAELILCGHENIIDYLPKKFNLIGVMFNLGYLPGKDRKQDFIITQKETTVQALKNIHEILIPQGCISIHCYTGHTGGYEEYQAVSDFVSSLNPREWRVLKTMDINREHNLEFLFLLEKLQQKKSY